MKPYYDKLTPDEIKRVDKVYPSTDNHRITVGMILWEWSDDLNRRIYQKQKSKEPLKTQEAIFYEYWSNVGCNQMRNDICEFIDAVDLAWHLGDGDWYWNFDFEFAPRFMNTLVIWDEFHGPELQPEWLRTVRKWVKIKDTIKPTRETDALPSPRNLTPVSYMWGELVAEELLKCP